MKTRTIQFDKDAFMWTNNRDYNIAFLKNLFEYWKDYLTCRDYIYLDKICESLGVNWNPDDENVCYRKEDTLDFGFIEIDENVYLISICKNS